MATPPLHTEYDVAIIGAGPVGLAIAIELARLELATLVVDRRPPLEADAGLRPQLLVARAGDLAHLEQLGAEVREPTLVSTLATRCETDLASGTVVTGDVRFADTAPARTADLWALARQPPVALVPIGRLQQALHARALAAGAELRYGCEVVRLRRHARFVSLVCGDGTSLRAAIAIVATGAARPLVAAMAKTVAVPEQRMIAGVLALAGDRGRWLRVEVPVDGFAEPVRCTLLQTSTDARAGTALLIDPRLGEAPESDERLHAAFAGATRALGLAGAPYLVSPQVFGTAVTSTGRRVLAGDGRAPVVIAGDAAQTGHVFSGQTCFVNLALALGLCAGLAHARSALRSGTLHADALLGALAEYGRRSEIGAAILAQASARHLAKHPPGAWALAGIARA